MWYDRPGNRDEILQQKKKGTSEKRDVKIINICVFQNQSQPEIYSK